MSSQMKVETVLSNCYDTLGEGPHWDVPSQTLMCVDISCGGVHRYNPDTHQLSKVKLDGTVGFVIPSSKGGHVVGLNKSLVRLDFDQQTVEPLVEVDAGTRNRFNDAKCDARGRLWAGTVGHEQAVNCAVMGLGTLYSFSPELQVTSHLSGLDISNGIDWTDDHSIMYFIDSQAYNVRAFDFDLEMGTIANPRPVVEFEDKSMVPDGMCVDAEGKIWVACYGGSRICRFDPETGKTLETVMFPATNITSCCFGGQHLDQLYVTSSRYALSDADMGKQPLAGSLFRVTGLGVKGRPANNFGG